MAFPDLLIALLADVLSSINTMLTAYVDMPANATGPLDPNIMLTSLGNDFVHELARQSMAWAGTIASTLNTLV